MKVLRANLEYSVKKVIEYFDASIPPEAKTLAAKLEEVEKLEIFVVFREWIESKEAQEIVFPYAKVEERPLPHNPIITNNFVVMSIGNGEMAFPVESLFYTYRRSKQRIPNHTNTVKGTKVSSQSDELIRRLEEYSRIIANSKGSTKEELLENQKKRPNLRFVQMTNTEIINTYWRTIEGQANRILMEGR